MVFSCKYKEGQKDMKKRRKIKKSVIWICLLFVVGIALSIFFLLSKKPSQVEVSPSVTPSPSVNVNHDLMSDSKVQKIYNSLLDANKINPEVVAYLEFNSKLISQPIAHTSDNEKYMEKNWEDMSYRSYGTAFTDYRNEFTNDDRNTIIYGHYVGIKRSQDRSLMFTPLEQLREEKNYEENKNLVVVTQDDIRYYQIALVYDCLLVEEDGYQFPPDHLVFNEVNYTDDLLHTYLTNAEKENFYPIAEKITDQDRFMTLQTCIEGNELVRQLVVCKEVERKEIPAEWRKK